MDVHIRPFGDADVAALAAAFRPPPTNKTAARFARYVADARADARVCLAAFADGAPAGYVTVLWRSAYPPFAAAGVPEIADLNVLPDFRRRGVATRLLQQAEADIARRAPVAGIGVGLHPGYNAAQRLYVRLGYVPDGNGVTHRNAFVREGMHVVLDDDLVLHLVKELR